MIYRGNMKGVQHETVEGQYRIALLSFLPVLTP
jgi:hypothetical protein